MIVRPRSGFEPIVKIIDSVNPILVVLSIAGLFVEYSPWKSWILPFNQVIDVIFVIDFMIRLVCHRPLRYLVHGYGWVDFLASLPGFMLLVAYTPLFAIFKFVRIGRVFRIVRVLRFLRIFGFLKRMKSDSPWIQDRVMKIGISIVLIFVAGIFALDTSLKAAFEAEAGGALQRSWTASGSDLPRFLAANPGILLYRQAGTIRQPDGGSPQGDPQALWMATLGDDLRRVIEVPLHGGTVEAVLLGAEELGQRHDEIMLITLTTLVLILLVVIFYLGAVFARDMSGVHLIIDSIEAGDFLLLRQEAERLGGGDLGIQPDEDELKSLVKAVARLSDGATGGEGPGGIAGLSGLAGIAGSQEMPGLGRPSAGSTPDGGRLAGLIEDLDARLSRIEDRVSSSNRELVVQTIRTLSPAIMKYLREAAKEGPGRGRKVE
ncbi:MAG: ion transporter [Spirochaetota bacterium]